MLEKDMEELIANYPEDFFPRKKLILKDRQRNFPGVGRFDLMFTDEHNTNILMELKARTAKYDDATQLAKYLDAMNAMGEKDILMWLIAPLIPNSVRDFLDRIGIEHSEIHIAEYRRIAKKYDHKLQSDSQQNIDLNRDKTPKQPQMLIGRNPNITFQGNYHSKIQAKYRAKRDSLYDVFNSGYNFLTSSENNNKDIWLGTSTNAHLYLRNNYLAYIVINNTALTFRARFNNQIYSGTVDKSGDMFASNFRKLILTQKGFENGWAIQRGENFSFTNSTPNEFFTSLIEYISKLSLE